MMKPSVLFIEEIIIKSIIIVFVLLFVFIFSSEITLADQDKDEHKKTKSRVLLVKKILRDYNVFIRQESNATGIPFEILVALIATESEGRQKALSSKKARGLMQTRNIADRETGIVCKNETPACQIKKGAYYLKYLVNEKKIPKWSKVFLAYNEGIKGSKKFNSRQTLRHVQVIKCNYYLDIVRKIKRETFK